MVFRVRDAQTLFESAAKAGVALIAREPLSNGVLTGKYSGEATWNFVKGDIRGNFPAPYLRATMRRILLDVSKM